MGEEGRNFIVYYSTIEKAMKTVINFDIQTFDAIAALSQIFYSCTDHNVLPVIKDNYFPLDENTTVVYREEYISTTDATATWWTDTTTLVVSGDTLIEGLR